MRSGHSVVTPRKKSSDMLKSWLSPLLGALLMRMMISQQLVLPSSTGFLAQLPGFTCFHCSLHCSRCCGPFRRFLRGLAIFLLLYWHPINVSSAAPYGVLHTRRFQRSDPLPSCNGGPRPLLVATPLQSFRPPYVSFFSSGVTHYSSWSHARAYLGRNRRGRPSLQGAAGLLLCIPSHCCRAADGHEERQADISPPLRSATPQNSHGGLVEVFRLTQFPQCIAACLTKSSEKIDDLPWRVNKYVQHLGASPLKAHRCDNVAGNTEYRGRGWCHPTRNCGHCICSQAAARKLEENEQTRSSCCSRARHSSSAESSGSSRGHSTEGYSTTCVKSGADWNVEPFYRSSHASTDTSDGGGGGHTWRTRGAARGSETSESPAGTCCFEEGGAAEVFCSLTTDPHAERLKQPPEKLWASQQKSSGTSNGSTSEGSSCGRHEGGSQGSADTRGGGRGILTWISDVLTRARLEQLVETTNMLLEQQGRTNRLYLVMPLTRNPSPDSFSFGHLMEGDKASFPRDVLSQILERRLDPPWHFLIEKVHGPLVENQTSYSVGAMGVPAAADGHLAVRVASRKNLRSADATSDSGTVVGGGSVLEVGEQAEAMADESAQGDANASEQVRRISVGILDFQAPSNYIFLPLWIMKALRLRPMSVVACSWVRLPMAEHIAFQPLEPGFLAAASGNHRDVQRCLEEELRHYSSLTARTVIPLRLGGKLFHLKVAELKPEKNGAVKTPDDDRERGDSTAALEAIPVADGSEHVCVQDTDVPTTLLPEPKAS